MWTQRLEFLRAFLCEPFTTGAICPSSPELAEVMVAGCDLPSRRLVVELGSGSGAFTDLILDRLPHQARLVAVEINERQARRLQERLPRARVCADSAEHLLDHVKPQRVECIVSGLAWGNMLPPTQDRIMRAICAALAPGGLFTTFAYVHAGWFPTTVRFRRLIREHFIRIERTPIIWRNVPPAFIYRCWTRSKRK